ncbi:hypothetical protein TrVFT333_004190 [Trichoderma virens FT-333]|nr:hypothetical protein TrVFT333_004190 [Trichoderma virens FT-333]
MVSELPSMTALTTATPPSPIPAAPILSSSNLASVFIDRRNSNNYWEVLLWQDGAGSLSYMDRDSERKGLGRVQTLLENIPKAKSGTPMAAVADDAGIAHLFYLDEDDIVSHAFMNPGGRWKRGGLSTGSKRTAAHRQSMLSAAFHQGEHDTNVVVLSYQDPDGNLQLAMSEDAKKNDWYTVNFSSFTGRHGIGDWGGIGHAVADSNGVGISPSSRSSRFAWIRTGHGQSKAPAETLPYEFAFLYLDSKGRIQESRVGVDVPRILGEGFHGDMVFDSLATNGNKTMYAKSGGNVVVFRLDADGWQWKVDGIVNMTISETYL